MSAVGEGVAEASVGHAVEAEPQGTGSKIWDDVSEEEQDLTQEGLAWSELCRRMSGPTISVSSVPARHAAI